MQIKTINKIIKEKLQEWLYSITDKKLSESLKENILLSGGSITSMLLGEKVNDYDIYIMDRDVLMKLVQYYTSTYNEIKILDGANKENLVKNLEEEYNNKIYDVHTAYSISLRNLKEDQIKLYFESKHGGLKVNDDIPVEKLNYTPLFFSPNAISLSNDIQIVIRFWGNAEEIHKTFDFIHATNYFTFKTGLVTNIQALESILTKQLKYQGSLYPVTSIIRTKKFLKRNWNCSAGELLKMMFQVSQLDLSNPDILDEQLVGVDVAYFAVLINVLRNKFEKEDDFKLSNEYFSELIDKIFNESETIE
jgi:hypothetical protein